MFDFIKILIFGGVTVVNSSPVTLHDEPTVIALDQRLKAINCSASISVDVTEYVESRDYRDFVRQIESKFEKGCLKATLGSKDGDAVIFDVPSVAWGSPEDVSINLRAGRGLSSGSSFEVLTIESCLPLSSTTIKWYNYGKFSCEP